jgi:hypothetical protein
VYVASEDELVGVRLIPPPESLSTAFLAAILETPNHSAYSLVEWTWSMPGNGIATTSTGSEHLAEREH